MPTAAQIKAELLTDPQHLGYAAAIAAGDLVTVASLLNARSYSAADFAPWKDVAKWGAATGVRAAIEDAALSTQSPVRAIALTLRDLMTGATSAGLDTTDPGLPTLLGALVQAGVMSAAQQAQLVALGNVPASRAELLWGVGTVVDHTSCALAMRS